MKRKNALVSLLVIINFLFAAADLHPFIQHVTEESIRDYYYRSDDPDWDNLNFHDGKIREEGTAGHDSVMAYIYQTLQGYLGDNSVYIHEFPWTDGTDGKGYNIIGVKPGRNGDHSDIWIAGAHYDSYDMDRTASAPGANDNGSGIVGLLEMARLIQTRESDATIIFGFWDAEEPRYSSHAWVSAASLGSDVYSGPSGSRAWLNDRITLDGTVTGNDTLLWSRIKGYINLDMFGYPGIDNTVWIYHGGSGWNDQVGDQESYYPTSDQVNDLYSSAQQYLSNYGYDDDEPANYLTVVGKGTMLYSDNTSFSRAGIASLEYAESDWNSDPHYHLWSDYYRPAGGDENYIDENPKINYMTKVIRGALALLADTAGVDLSPDIPTPVDLISFKGISEERQISLTWSTGSETGTLGYLLEKRSEQFSDWIVLADYLTDQRLLGQGTTSALTDYSFNDTCVCSGTRYRYRLSEVTVDGTIKPLRTATVDYLGGERPLVFHATTSPNPFNPRVRIQFDLMQPANISVHIYDVNGRKVRTLATNVSYTEGQHYVDWNAQNDASGIYIVQLCAERIGYLRTISVQKVILKK